MPPSTIAQLEVYGPNYCETLSVEQARAWCRRQARGHYENFSVLSSLVPKHLRDDFAAVYAFCRWADDLGDEVGNRDRALELLQWWRRELEQCFDGQPRHPVFIALAPTVEKHSLPIEPFDALIRAFEQDQTVTRYQNWDQLLEYCARSANPVGRLVLMMLSEPRTEDFFTASDFICTALQLTNHWQDVARDIVERDRIYIPRELITVENFDDRLRRSAKQGYAVDHAFLAPSRSLIRACVDRTWPLYEQGEPLLRMIKKDSQPIIWLFLAGGTRVLRLIEMWNYETVLHRPKLHRLVKATLVGRAWLAARW